jgi:hypothetical protein
MRHWRRRWLYRWQRSAQMPPCKEACSVWQPLFWRRRIVFARGLPKFWLWRLFQTLKEL